MDVADWAKNAAKEGHRRKHILAVLRQSQHSPKDIDRALKAHREERIAFGVQLGLQFISVFSVIVVVSLIVLATAI